MMHFLELSDTQLESYGACQRLQWYQPSVIDWPLGSRAPFERLSIPTTYVFPKSKSADETSLMQKRKQYVI